MVKVDSRYYTIYEHNNNKILQSQPISMTTRFKQFDWKLKRRINNKLNNQKKKIEQTYKAERWANPVIARAPSEGSCQRFWSCLANEGWLCKVNGSECSLGAGMRVYNALPSWINKSAVCFVPDSWHLCHCCCAFSGLFPSGLRDTVIVNDGKNEELKSNHWLLFFISHREVWPLCFLFS